jgi:SAM-dependent methyltransferase
MVSTFETAALEENAYDLICAGSAFHWVTAEIGCPKVYRLLKDGGTFALFRYNFNNPQDGSPLILAIQSAYDKHYSTYYPAKMRPKTKTLDDFILPDQLKEDFGFADMGEYGFHDITHHFVQTKRAFTADDYILFLETLSDIRGLPDENREALCAEVKTSIQKYGGIYEVDHVFHLYMGRK